jgi:hypothetical protein
MYSQVICSIVCDVNSPVTTLCLHATDSIVRPTVSTSARLAAASVCSDSYSTTSVTPNHAIRIRPFGVTIT